jgi:phosphoserine aminotransferase
VLLGNGGATEFWDIATFGLIEQKSQHLSFGEFSSKFATAAQQAPFLDEPSVVKSDPGTHPLPVAEPGVDLYALTHNETSTGVMMPIARVEGADEGALVAVDRHQRAGGLPVDASQFDVYYFSPQKCFASDGGLWLALVSPAAVERIARVKASGRWVPASYDLSIALDNSRLDQTYNTPRLGTIFLMAEQVDWMNAQGGLPWAVSRPKESSDVLYGWAGKSPVASPFVTEPSMRSQVIGHDRLRRGRRRRADREGAAQQRDRGHRAVPQARPQPAAHRDVPGGRAVGRRGAHRVHRPRRGAALSQPPLPPGVGAARLQRRASRRCSCCSSPSSDGVRRQALVRQGVLRRLRRAVLLLVSPASPPRPGRARSAVRSARPAGASVRWWSCPDGWVGRPQARLPDVRAGRAGAAAARRGRAR